MILLFILLSASLLSLLMWHEICYMGMKLNSCCQGWHYVKLEFETQINNRTIRSKTTGSTESNFVNMRWCTKSSIINNLNPDLCKKKLFHWAWRRRKNAERFASSHQNSIRHPNNVYRDRPTPMNSLQLRTGTTTEKPHQFVISFW